MPYPYEKWMSRATSMTLHSPKTEKAQKPPTPIKGKWRRVKAKYYEHRELPLAIRGGEVSHWTVLDLDKVNENGYHIQIRSFETLGQAKHWVRKTWREDD